MEQMTNHGTGWVRMEFLVPARGLIGFRTKFLTDTRAIWSIFAHHISEGYEPWTGDVERPGSLVVDRSGAATAYAMTNLQERGGILFWKPTTEVYEGMIVGENSGADDMDVNITKEKQQTNIRFSTSDNFEKLVPPRRLSLEQCLRVLPRGRSASRSPRRASGSASWSSTRTSAPRWPPAPASPANRESAQIWPFVDLRVGASSPGTRGESAPIVLWIMPDPPYDAG